MSLLLVKDQFKELYCTTPPRPPQFWRCGVENN